MVVARLIPRISRSAFRVAQANNRLFNANRTFATQAAASGSIRYVVDQTESKGAQQCFFFAPSISTQLAMPI